MSKPQKELETLGLQGVSRILEELKFFTGRLSPATQSLQCTKSKYGYEKLLTRLSHDESSQRTCYTSSKALRQSTLDVSSSVSSSPVTRAIFRRWPLLPSPPRCSRFSPFRLPFHHASYTSASTFTEPKYHTRSRIYYEQNPERDAPYRWSSVFAEPLAEYRTGGYHPVHVGDTM